MVRLSRNISGVRGHMKEASGLDAVSTNILVLVECKGWVGERQTLD